MLTLVWLGLLGLQTILVGGKSQEAPLQDEVERKLAARAARIARYASGLDERERQIFAGLAGSEPPLSEDTRAADRDLTWFFLASCWLLGVLIGGPLVLLWWLTRGRRKQAEPPEAPPLSRAWLAFLTYQLMANVLVNVVVEIVHVFPPPSQVVVAANLVIYGLGLAVIRPMVGPFRPSWRGLLQGLATFWAATLGVFLATKALEAILGHPLASQNQALDLFRNAGPTALVWLGALVVLAGPFFEEYLYRGLMFGAMRRPWGELLATLLSAALFAFVHRDPAIFVSYMVLGLVFARAYAITGSLFPAMVAHMLTNGQVFVLLCLLAAG